MLVEQEEHAPVADMLGERSRRIERLRDTREHERGIPERSEWDPPNSVGIAVCREARRLESETRLARARRTGERDEPDVVAGEEYVDLGKLGAAPEKRGRRDGQIGLEEGLQPWELAGPELVDPFGSGQVLQPVAAEILEHRLGSKGGRGGGNERLPPVPRSGYARCAMDVRADIALIREARRARVNPDPDPDRPVAEIVLHSRRRVQGRGRRREGEEEGIALRVDLMAASLREGLSYDRAMPGESGFVFLLAKIGQETRRALDVGEDEGDRSRREVSHVHIASCFGLRLQELLASNLRAANEGSGRHDVSMDMNKMLQQVQQMQEQMVKAQEELAHETVEASVGGGMVIVKANGSGEITEIRISPEAIDPDDPEGLSDLVLAGVNEALRNAQELQQSKLGGAMGGLKGLGLPGL